MAAPLSNLTMARGLCFLIAVAASAAPSTDARAMCAFDGDPYLSVPSGERLPPDPVLLVMRAKNTTRIEPRADGVPTTYERVALGGDVVSIWVHTRSAHVLTVVVGDHTYGYAIDPAWTRSASRIGGRVRRTYNWTCSFEDTIAVAIEGNAIAYQARWSDREGDAVWLPTDPELAWHATGRAGGFVIDAEGPVVAARPAFALLALGHGNCAHWNVPAELYERHGTVWLTALHADGSREALGPVALDSESEVPSLVSILDLTPPPRLRADPPHERRTKDARLPMSLALAAALATLLLVRRRRSTFTR